MSLTSMVSDFTKIQVSPLQKNADKTSNAGNRKENSSYILEKRKCTTNQRNCVFGRKFLFILT